MKYLLQDIIREGPSHWALGGEGKNKKVWVMPFLLSEKVCLPTSNTILPIME